jgi:NADP-dependent 3-hydroxy acid dehydrogenase YdfG
MNRHVKPLVVVTGASSGIGASIARRLSAEGHALLLIARRIEKIEALDLPAAICRKVDVTDTAAFRAAVCEAEAVFGPVDCLVNNAGVMLLGQLDVQDPDEWRKMFDLNVLAMLGTMQTVLPSMKSRKNGSIINISSIAGKKTFANHAAYVGTKFAVSSMSENIREEVAESGVRIMTICPGAVETELLEHTTNNDIIESYQAWKESMGGVISPDDIARAVSFMYEQPQNVNIRELVIAATRQGA